jgi:hypothetical protein
MPRSHAPPLHDDHRHRPTSATATSRCPRSSVHAHAKDPLQSSCSQDQQPNDRRQQREALVAHRRVTSLPSCADWAD